jgi:hypothetical protein
VFLATRGHDVTPRVPGPPGAPPAPPQALPPGQPRDASGS